MANSNGFQFKQFFVAHDRCAMKVNTDGILLGAIAPLTASTQRILDIGTGTGLIALMLAQRSGGNAHITALEIEPQAVSQATENAKNSPWATQISVQQGDLMDYQPAHRFDLIVTNPPYFADSLASRSPERDLARMATQSHLDWLKRGQDWLTPQGKISVILPRDAGDKLQAQAHILPLFCHEKWLISPQIGRPAKRVILTFARHPAPLVAKTLSIYQADQQYSDDFRALTRAFYLHL